MSTTLMQRNLWKKLQGKKYRHSFVSSQIGASVAAQIASTRVARGWTQKELAARAKMSQVRISVLEDPNYENFSIKTLKRLAEAFDTALILKFAPFSEMLGWLTTLGPEHLAVPRFQDDRLNIERERPLHIPDEIKHGDLDERRGNTAATAAGIFPKGLPPSYGEADARSLHAMMNSTQQPSAGRLQCA